LKIKTLNFTLQRGIIHAVYKNYDTTGDITFKISDESIPYIKNEIYDTY
jgi:hypothetical protein